MAAISVRDLDDDVRERLRIRAAENGRSMEAEARAILTEAVSDRHAGDLFTTLLDDFAIDLDVPARVDPARASDFRG
jgi:plasmid stability protein